MTSPTTPVAVQMPPLPVVAWRTDSPGGCGYSHVKQQESSYALCKVSDAQAYAAQQVAALEAKLAAAEAEKEKLIQTLKGCADSQYCAGVAMSRQEACLGWGHKVEKGKYGYTEHQAHAAANKAFGAYFGIYKALNLAALTPKEHQ